MAGASSYEKYQVDDSLTCSVCFEKYNSSDHLPKILPCQHTFCSTCLQNLSSRPNNMWYECPVCRRRIPSKLIVHTNLAVRDIIEEMRAKQRQMLFCHDHPGKQCSLVCTDCCRPICAVCVKGLTKGTHRDHNIDDIEDVKNYLVERFSKLIQQKIASLETFRDDADKIAQSCESYSEKINTVVKMLTDDLTAWKDDQSEARREVVQPLIDKQLKLSQSLEKSWKDKWEGSDLSTLVNIHKEVNGKVSEMFACLEIDISVQKANVDKLQKRLASVCDKIREQIQKGDLPKTPADTLDSPKDGTGDGQDEFYDMMQYRRLRWTPCVCNSKSFSSPCGRAAGSQSAQNIATCPDDVWQEDSSNSDAQTNQLPAITMNPDQNANTTDKHSGPDDETSPENSSNSIWQENDREEPSGNSSGDQDRTQSDMKSLCCNLQDAKEAVLSTSASSHTNEEANTSTILNLQEDNERPSTSKSDVTTNQSNPLSAFSPSVQAADKAGQSAAQEDDWNQVTEPNPFMQLILNKTKVEPSASTSKSPSMPPSPDVKPKHGCNVIEIQASIVDVPSFVSILHYITMDGSGEFQQQQFDGLHYLCGEHPRAGQLAYRQEPSRFIYYLITHEMSAQTASSTSFLMRVFTSLRAHCAENRVVHLAIPRSGWGPFEYWDVRRRMAQIFYDTFVHILVYKN